MENLTFIVYLISRLDALYSALWAIGFGFIMLGICVLTRHEKLVAFLQTAQFKVLEEVTPQLFEFWKSQVSAQAKTTLAAFTVNTKDENFVYELVRKMEAQDAEKAQTLREKLKRIYSSHFLFYCLIQDKKGWSKGVGRFYLGTGILCFILALATPTTQNGVRILAAYGVQEAVSSSSFRGYASDIAEFMRYYLEEKSGEVADAAKKLTSSDKAADAVDDAKKQEADSKAKPEDTAKKPQDFTEKTVEVAKAVRKTVDAVQEISDIVKK